MDSDEKIKKSWEDYKKNRSQYNDYKERFCSTKGGLYEDDGFTHLIKASLKVIKPKKMLVVEDLDRMDPAHLFRILNVFGAHVDSDKNNKFGFDNIVLVMDYEMTEHIFHHFYGSDANYSGYINKFVSSYPFKFSIREVARKNVHFLIQQKCNLSISDLERLTVSSSTNFNEHLASKSVRDIAKALDGLENQFKVKEIHYFDYSFSSDIPILWLLAIMKRLDMTVNASNLVSLEKHLDPEFGANFIGNLMITANVENGALFRVRDAYLVARISQNNGVSSCIFFKHNPVNVLSAENESKYANLVRKAIDNAFGYIRDMNE